MISGAVSANWPIAACNRRSLPSTSGGTASATASWDGVASRPDRAMLASVRRSLGSDMLPQLVAPDNVCHPLTPARAGITSFAAISAPRQPIGNSGSALLNRMAVRVGGIASSQARGNCSWTRCIHKWCASMRVTLAENCPRPVTVRSLFTGRTAARNSLTSVVSRPKLDDIQVPLHACHRGAVTHQLIAYVTGVLDLDQGSEARRRSCLLDPTPRGLPPCPDLAAMSRKGVRRTAAGRPRRTGHSP